jgi:tetrahydromethanopterin S-methyltransferase subunit H
MGTGSVTNRRERKATRRLNEMLNFATEQQVVEVGGVRFGGQPGENPTVLLGTVFYGKRFKELDGKALELARDMMGTGSGMMELTGVPCVVDVFIPSAERIRPHMEFALEHLEPGAPVSVDAPESDVRRELLAYLDEVGALDRTIYNSLNMGLTDGEREDLARHTPAAAIVLGYNPRDFSTDGRMAILEDGAGLLDQGLIAIAREAGIRGLLLDTAATPFDHSAGEFIRALPVFKNKWGLPVGCAIHNTVESWLWMKSHRRENPEGKTAFRICDAASNLLVIGYGGDFTYYGPLDNSASVFPAVAMADKFMAEGAEDYFGISQDEGHPRRKLK